MHQRLALLTLLVRDYDEAIAFYTKSLGWILLEDTLREPGKRWVRVAPQPTTGAAHGACAFLLARATTPEQRAAVGRQTGGRVMGFIETNDLARDHARMLAAGVGFEAQPRQEAYGAVVVFEDLYGNRFDLIEPRETPSAGSSL